MVTCTFFVALLVQSLKYLKIATRIRNAMANPEKLQINKIYGGRRHVKSKMKILKRP